jgi:tetratricopeptide (TPR) repeat protein
MRKIIIPVFLVLTLLSSTAMGETADDWCNRANELSDGKKYTDPLKAIEFLNNAIKLQPNDAGSFYNRGVAYDDLGQYKRAIKDYNQAIILKPDYAEAFYNRGTINNTIGQYQRAIEDFDETIRLNPQDAEAYLGRGFACDKLGQYRRAIENYDKSIGLIPDYARAYNNRGVDYFSLGNNTQGCFDAQKACALGNCKLLKMAQNKGLCR